MKKFILLLILLSFVACAQSEKQLTIETVNKAEIEGHIYFLAADEMRGRATGTPEIDIAAIYLASEFRKYGVEPVDGSYFQEISFMRRDSTIMTGKNVVGIVEGTDPELKDEFILYSAHYDHIGVRNTGQPDSIFNGARDNAVGTVTVLSAAENIAKYPTRRSAIFILWTAEEMGLRGSRYFAENPLIPLQNIVYCFNSDNGGYNDTSIATIVGLGRTTAEADIRQACEAFGLRAIDDPAGEQGLFDRSDNVNFARKGIPAPTFSLGFTAFDEEIMKYYHQVADEPDNLDYEYLEKFFRSYVLACRLIANNPETPFWVENDKYYNAGKALYDR